ncbi:LCP family protein [Paenibacillus sp. PAMC21692]|uniref:LCP family protein n=1 Tax=Paenibacillus sp. PAMC21692 TaxID=2762320 RepID=UPI00164DFE49|nr:LCP family protein [Paenibacillus sp. PAMC21692]QNK58028.1 LCP family protein [Paenibacillus sp. PAMC21692]
MKKKHKRLYAIGIIAVVLLTAAYLNRGVLAMAGFDWFLQGSLEKSLENTYKPVENRQPVKPVGVDRKKQDPFSMLLLGVDQRGNETGRSDTLIYTVVRPNDGKMLLVSIPRDLYVEIVGRDREDKINHAYAFGGPGMTMDTVEKLLDAPVNHYASINFEGFRDAIDAMGGIALPIEEDMVNDDYDHEKFVIKGGQDLYNGTDALNFVRYREDAGGDMNRTERHQQFLHAIIEKATSLKQWSKIPSLIDIMGDNFSTDMLPGQLIDMSQSMLTKSGLNMYSHTVLGQGGRLENGGAWYYFVDEGDLQQVQTMIHNWLDADAPSASLILPPKYTATVEKEVQSLSSASGQ